MLIKHLEIQNFRKLKRCRLDISEKETILVGANNSGKTTAMDALIFFLKDKDEIKVTDFTLSNWIELNKIGEDWYNSTEDKEIDFSLDKWINYLPSLDIWIEVSEDEVHYIANLIPSLDWEGGLIGVRLLYAPKNIEHLYKDFVSIKNTNSKLKENTPNLDLWPKDIKDYLTKEISTSFSIKSYVLDSKKFDNKNEQIVNPQKLDNYENDLGANPFERIIKINTINAQRGFSDSNNDKKKDSDSGKLSSQLRDYYLKHLNPEDNPTEADIDVLLAISDAQRSFDNQLRNSFNPSINELETLGYPGVQNPNITLCSKVNPLDSINHSAAVRFNISKDNSGNDFYSLPENYNGLGYQNLVSMVFRLMRFRDDWLKKGNRKIQSEDIYIEPIHLVLIEEPEAHLHVQVQQVFVRKAHEVLTADPFLVKNSKFNTQIILSTHSSHIANELDFANLRYFKRVEPKGNIKISTAAVVNLSSTFGTIDETNRFATRYLKVTHCDIFFADAVILVEGAAERMLLPQFIAKYKNELLSHYFSILEIGGSHAHRLKPIIEALDIPTLVITDLDSCDPNDNNKSKRPEKGKGYKTNNNSLKEWIPAKDDLDKLLSLSNEQKVSDNNKVYITYQYPFEIELNNNKIEINPYTFEDALFFTNIDLFKESTGIGMVAKFKNIAGKYNDIDQLSAEAYDIVKKSNNSKAKFALDILVSDEFCKMESPQYIQDGLDWLSKILSSKKEETKNE